MRLSAIVAVCTLSLSFTASALPVGTASSAIVQDFASGQRKGATAIQRRTLADLVISAAGAGVSLGFLGVTGAFYQKTFGKRRQSHPDVAESPSSLSRLDQDRVYRTGTSLTRRTDYYPIIIGTAATILSGFGVANNALAHVRLKHDLEKHPPQSRRDDHLPWTLQERDKAVAVVKSTALAKTMELMAASISALSIPFALGNVLAIGRHSSKQGNGQH